MALAEDGYITTTIDSDQSPGPLFFKLGERGRQIVARWPGGSSTDNVQALLLELDRRIENASDDGERGRLNKLRDSLVDIGTDLAAKILANMAMPS